MAQERFSVGILAGGKSERMGFDKATARIGGETLLERLVREFTGFDVIVSIAEPGAFGVPAGCRTVSDENRDKGPMEGLRRILSEAESERVFICAVDMPFVTRGFAEYLAGFLRPDHDCYIVTSGGLLHPLCGIWSRSALPVVEELLAADRLRLRGVFERVPTLFIPIEESPFDETVVLNVNTPEELFRIEKP